MYFMVFIFYSAISQKKDSLDTFRKNKILFAFIYNQPLLDTFKTTYIPNNNDLPLIDSIKSKIKPYTDFGLRFNYALFVAKHASFYHIFRLNFYFHRQQIQFNNTIYRKHYTLTTPIQVKYEYKYFIDMLNLAILPEYVLRYKLNSKVGLQFGFGYNFSYTMYYNYDFYKLIVPFLVNKNFYINNYQFNLSALIRIKKNILLEQGFYWFTNPLWNKYIGILAGVNF